MGRRRLHAMNARLAAAFLAASLLSVAASAAEPIKIGFGMALTGGLAGNGKAALVAMQIWAEEVNAKGGLLGRPVQLIYYDDQTNPALVPGIYTKLLDVDKVDLVVSGYGTNLQAPAMPIIMQRGMPSSASSALAVNDQFHYDRYFQIQPNGHECQHLVHRGLLRGGDDGEADAHRRWRSSAPMRNTRRWRPRARARSRKSSASRSSMTAPTRRPPSTTRRSSAPSRRPAPTSSIVASYPPDSAGMVRAVHEVGLKTTVFGGGLIGLQFAALKQQLGEMLNGIICYDMYAPAPTMNFPGITEFLTKYQPRAKSEGADQLGFYLPPFAYAAMQILGQAVETTKGLDQATIAQYIHATAFKTVVGEVKFADNGEWAKARVIFVQYRGIAGTDLEQFKKPGAEVIVAPDEYRTGDVEAPYSDIKH